VVIGVGIDLAAVSYWRTLMEEGRTTALEEIFTPGERARASAPAGDPAQRLAARFAAKEAFLKALAAARLHQEQLARLPLDEIELKNDAHGRPYLLLHGSAAAAAAHLGVRRIWVSISHESHLAAAVVVLEG
jgi:holo-[acyl-carrier protein] synthase